MNRKYHVFKNSVLQARTLTFGKAVDLAKAMTGDVRIVNGTPGRVVWANKGDN